MHSKADIPAGVWREHQPTITMPRARFSLMLRAHALRIEIKELKQRIPGVPDMWIAKRFKRHYQDQLYQELRCKERELAVLDAKLHAIYNPKPC